MTFRIGQKVVCVDDADFWSRSLVARPVKGAVYTVRDFTRGIDANGLCGEGVLLVGVNNPLGFGGNEHGFKFARFRPIVERKTDISIFTAMLTPNKTRVKA